MFGLRSRPIRWLAFRRGTLTAELTPRVVLSPRSLARPLPPAAAAAPILLLVLLPCEAVMSWCKVGGGK